MTPTDYQSTIENVMGGFGGDTCLLVTLGATRLTGGAGVDTLSGEATPDGADTMGADDTLIRRSRWRHASRRSRKRHA